MRLVPNNENQLTGPPIGEDIAADSTWRSMALQRHIIANTTDEDKEADAKLTLDDLNMALTRSGVLAAEYAPDNGSYSADKLIIPPTGGPGSAYGG